MAFNNYNNRSRGLRGLRWKKSNYGTAATMWCRQSKKSGVFKYTVTEGGTQYTFLIDLNKSPVDLESRSGRSDSFFPVTVLASKPSSMDIF